MTKTERDDLIVGHLPLVTKEARRLVRKLPASVDVDDLIGVGQIALVQAADTFKPERGDFAQWASWKVRFAMLNSVRRGNWTDATASSINTEQIPDDSMGPETLYLLHCESRDNVIQMLQPLSDRERQVVHGIYVLGETQRQVGMRLENSHNGNSKGVCSTRVTQLHGDAIRKMRDHRGLHLVKPAAPVATTVTATLKSAA